MRRPEIVNKIAAAMKSIAPEATTILYGSEARGEARPDSDIDLLVLLPDNEKNDYSLRKLAISNKLFEIELVHDVLISPLILLRSMWEARKTPFTCNVSNDGILL